MTGMHFHMFHLHLWRLSKNEIDLGVGSDTNQQKSTMTTNNTILSDVETFDVNNMVFSEPQVVSIPDSDLKFKRINLGVTNPDGSLGDIVLRTESLFSFGVSEETSRETGKVSGYKMPLCCWSRDGPGHEENLLRPLLEDGKGKKGGRSGSHALCKVGPLQKG